MTSYNTGYYLSDNLYYYQILQNEKSSRKGLFS